MTRSGRIQIIVNLTTAGVAWAEVHAQIATGHHLLPLLFGAIAGLQVGLAYFNHTEPGGPR